MWHWRPGCSPIQRAHHPRPGRSPFNRAHRYAPLRTPGPQPVQRHHTVARACPQTFRDPPGPPGPLNPGVARACPVICQGTPVQRPGMPLHARATEHTARTRRVRARVQGVYAAVYGPRVGPNSPPGSLRRIGGHTINRIIYGHIYNQAVVVFEHTGAE